MLVPENLKRGSEEIQRFQSAQLTLAADQASLYVFAEFHAAMFSRFQHLILLRMRLFRQSKRAAAQYVF